MDGGRLPGGWQGGKEIVLAITLAVQLADVLRLGAAEASDGQFRIFMEAVWVGDPGFPGFAGRLGCIGKTVFADGFPQAMHQ